MIRLIVSTQELVWRVANVKWPVSAVRRAASIVSQIPHFADEDDVRVLTENVPKGGAKTFCIGVHLSLIDDALLMPVKIFDRILNGNDVRASFIIDLINHRGQRRRLSCSCWTRYQDQPFWFLNQLPGNGGDPKSAKFRISKEMARKAPATAPRCM